MRRSKNMSQFVYLYRLPPMPPASPQVIQERIQTWTAWMKGLDAKGHIASPGHPLKLAGGVVREPGGSFTDGPYAETKDVIIGFSVIEAKDLAEALALAATCPIVGPGGLVEVRPVAQM
jgi:hypothetical protein